MELVIVVGGLVALDILAYFFGRDSREVAAPDHHDLAVNALRRGDLATYRQQLGEFEREASRVPAVRS
jgi:hypothetical protein